MNDWRKEIETALIAFVTVSQLANDPVQLGDLEVEFLDAPHVSPAKLPSRKMAIYGFWWNGTWLKIGKAGPNSNARYTYQHYDAMSAQSTLAGSLANDLQMNKVIGFDKQNPGEWIKASTCRVNILIAKYRRRELLSLLEAFLHVRLHPRYEGLSHAGEAAEYVIAEVNEDEEKVK